MWKIASNIEINNENRDINEVDCYMRTIGILIYSINKENYRKFIYLSTLYKCYGCFHKVSQISDWYFNIYFLAAEKSGIKMVEQTCANAEKFREQIHVLLNCNQPPIVPVNLKYIFYSDEYMKRDAIKLFLIVGYNESLKLFEIVDNLHNIAHINLNNYGESNQYTSFILPEDILFLAWKMCNGQEYGFWDNKIVFCKESRDSNKEVSIKEEVCRIEISKERPMEIREIYSGQILIDYLKVLPQNKVLKDDIHYNSVIEAKKTLLLMTLNYINETIQNAKRVELEKTIYEILGLWRRFRNLIYYKYYKGCKVEEILQLRYFFEPILDKEKELYRHIKTILL